MDGLGCSMKTYEFPTEDVKTNILLFPWGIGLQCYRCLIIEHHGSQEEKDILTLLNNRIYKNIKNKKMGTNSSFSSSLNRMKKKRPEVH